MVCLLSDILCPAAVQQLEFLEGRKKQYMKAALQAKQKNDMEQAKIFLRTAKGFEPMIDAARSGKSVDISTVSRWVIHSLSQLYLLRFFTLWKELFVLK